MDELRLLQRRDCFAKSEGLAYSVHMGRARQCQSVDNEGNVDSMKEVGASGM